MDSKGKRQYYRYLGNRDGSQCPHGIVYKCYTDEEYEHFKQFYRLKPEIEDRKCGRIAVIGKVKQVVTIASLINAISGGVYFSQYEEDEE